MIYERLTQEQADALPVEYIRVTNTDGTINVLTHKHADLYRAEMQPPSATIKEELSDAT